jgi:hypothetical protein
MTKKEYARTTEENTRKEAATDYNKFYTYFDVTRGLIKIGRPILMPERREAYDKMIEISAKYPHDNTLKNKLDEADAIVWPTGRKDGR